MYSRPRIFLPTLCIATTRRRIPIRTLRHGQSPRISPLSPSHQISTAASPLTLTLTFVRHKTVSVCVCVYACNTKFC
jgi:hypothetical protein